MVTQERYGQNMSKVSIKKPELLLPAGGPDTLDAALRYGADAVYMGGEAFSLRAKARNFSFEEMEQSIAKAHKAGVKVYVTANIIAHNKDLDEAGEYFSRLRDMENRPDGILIADPGMFEICKDKWPDCNIHISTQANNTNYATCRFWHAQGAGRIVVGRELSLEEIRQIRENIPDDMEIEAFVHGAMCISYSGRCLLSSYMTGRDSNRGECTHPCRWKYHVVEESRPGEYMPVEESERGTFIFSSKDLCMIDHLPDMINAGIDSLKVEGRMKNPLYVASVARSYRCAIDDYFESPEKYEERKPVYLDQISMTTFRPYGTGFFYGNPSEGGQIYDGTTYESRAIYLGSIEKVEKSECDTCVTFMQKNKFSVGEEFEIMKPDGRNLKARTVRMYDPEGRQMDSCPHASMMIKAILETDSPDLMPEEGDVMRMITEGRKTDRL